MTGVQTCALPISLGEDGHYQQRPAGVSFPNLPPTEIEGVLHKLGTASETALVRSFRQWVRTANHL